MKGKCLRAACRLGPAGAVGRVVHAVGRRGGASMGPHGGTVGRAIGGGMGRRQDGLGRMAAPAKRRLQLVGEGHVEAWRARASDWRRALSGQLLVAAEAEETRSSTTPRDRQKGTVRQEPLCRPACAFLHEVVRHMRCAVSRWERLRGCDRCPYREGMRVRGGSAERNHNSYIIGRRFSRALGDLDKVVCVSHNLGPLPQNQLVDSAGSRRG